METLKKLTVRVDAQALEGAQRYAARHGISLSRLISTFLGSLSQAPPADDLPPMVRRLTGVLPRDAGGDDRYAYLDEKYGR